MKYCFILILVTLIISCKNNNGLGNYPKGIYVEETLRLDTIDFTINNLIDATEPHFKFDSKTFADPLNPGVTIYNSSLYTFKIKSHAEIEMRSMLSSSSFYQTYYFNWKDGNSFFEIDKFYNRPNIPGRLKFVKL